MIFHTNFLILILIFLEPRYHKRMNLGDLSKFLMIENLAIMQKRITNGITGDKLTSFSQNSYLLPITQNKILSAGIGKIDSKGIMILQENS